MRKVELPIQAAYVVHMKMATFSGSRHLWGLLINKPIFNSNLAKNGGL